MTVRESFFMCSIVCLFLLFITPSITYSEENNTGTINSEFEDVMRIFELGKIEIAMYMLQQISEKYPDSEELLMKLSEMALSNKNWAYAIELLEDVAAVKPDDVDIRFILMDIYKAYQMSIQEIKTAREILNIDPDNVKALYRLTRLYHTQYMITDEVETRKKIASIDPGDQENLTHLALLYAEEGDVWKEIEIREMIFKHYPENDKNKRRLVYLYGLDKDLFRKLLMLEHILKGSHTALPRIKAEYRETKREYKKSMSLADVFQSHSLADLLETPGEGIFTYSEELFHKTFSLKSNSSFQLQLAYSGIDNVAKDNVQENYHVGKVSLGGTYNTATYNNITKFSLTAGVDSINIYETGTGVSPPHYTSDYFFLEASANNKFFPFMELNFNTQLLHSLYLDSHFYSAHIETIDSYIAPLRDNDLGANLYLLFPDQTLFLMGGEFHWIWDELIRFRLVSEFYYILYATNPIHDYNGNRTGYLKEAPDKQIDVALDFELYNNGRRIPYYEEDEIIHNYGIVLGFSQKFKELFILRIEGAGEFSGTMDYAVGANLGLHYTNAEENFYSNINLYYRYLNVLPLFGEETITPGHNVGIEFLIDMSMY